MKVNYIDGPFPYTIIDNYYDQKELDGIWQELDFFQHKLLSHEETFPAQNVFGKSLKKNHGLFLDDVFEKRRNLSNILNINRKILVSSTYRDHPSWFYQNAYIDLDYTLLSYYENGDYYDQHQDTGVITILEWFYKGETKKFSGGDLHFPKHDIDIEVKNNRLVVFPSMIPHSVDEIKMDQDDLNKGLGRWCMTQFLGTRKTR